ncbi:MAG: flagellar biosynthesis anti-sigma factor FlgM [Geobacteraceae bacterium]|nr:flagellar biosynthesis anti-sigma factor FlgM [Geobacteraceae bacterium]
MKIDNGTISPGIPMDTKLKKPALHAAPAAPHPAIPAGEAFKVELSSKAGQPNKPESPDEISHDRVAAIRDQLAAGTYNISGKDVANKILGVLKG